MSRVTQPTSKQTYSDWFAEASAILQSEHGFLPTAIRPRGWKNMFMRNMSPAEAAERAATKAFNALPPGERLLRGRH
jgi:hypothetical protein